MKTVVPAEILETVEDSVVIICRLSSVLCCLVIVLDPPIAADLDKKVKPKRALICILSVTVAGFLAIFLAFFLEYIHNVREGEDEERLNKLRKYLKLKPSKNSESRGNNTAQLDKTNNV